MPSKILEAKNKKLSKTGHSYPIFEQSSEEKEFQQDGHQSREEMISIAAYYRAEKRGFADGDQVSDWLDAEAEIDELLGNHGMNGFTRS
jgi:hypothetical protein